MRSKSKRMSVEELGEMSVDEKIALALKELVELDKKRSTPWRRKRRDQITYALEAWWMVKGLSVR